MAYKTKSKGDAEEEEVDENDNIESQLIQTGDDEDGKEKDARKWRRCQGDTTMKRKPLLETFHTRDLDLIYYSRSMFVQCSAIVEISSRNWPIKAFV